jgi:hypothetical protein
VWGVNVSRRAEWSIAAAAFLWGALLNFPWELAQMPLYVQRAPSPWGGPVPGCLMASLMDGIAIAIIYCIGAMQFHAHAWVCRPGVRGWFLTLGLGFAGAALVERAALTLGWWQYGPAMPIVPGLGAGLSPLLQFLVLPPAALFFGTCRWLRKRG